MTLLADIPLPFDDRGVVCDFTLAEGQTATFVLSYGHGRPASLGRRRTSEKLDHTQRYWRGLVARMNYEGLWRDSVVRSFLALHLMMYQRTGAIVAAPTTSLPETIGGSRNWDYRFSWLRDTAFTVDILYRLGDAYGGRSLHALALGPVPVRPEENSDRLRHQPDFIAPRIHSRPSERIRKLSSCPHRQRRSRPSANGRFRRSHPLHPFPAGASRRDSGGKPGSWSALSRKP